MVLVSYVEWTQWSGVLTDTGPAANLTQTSNLLRYQP